MAEHNQREEYGKKLLELCRNNRNVVALDADLCRSTMSCRVEDELPLQYFEMGIGEQNMMGVAAGFSLAGKIPFVNSFAVFVTGRAFDQVRQAICNASLNVKIVGSSAGLSDFGDGSSHQTVEDIAIMRSLPNMTVIVPADGPQAYQATAKAAFHPGPVYLRISRNNLPDITFAEDAFEIGRVYKIRDGRDITLFACGIMVAKALEAATVLENEGISVMVVNVPTIKPLNRDEIVRLARATGAVVTTEEHNVSGGLGCAISEALCGEKIPVEYHGVNDRFGCSCNDPDALLEYFGLTSTEIIKRVKSILKQK